MTLWDYNGKEWVQVTKEEKTEKTIYLNENLKKRLDKIKSLMAMDWDAAFCIDGLEGSGKSTLSFVCAYYISDTNFSMNNVAEGTEDAMHKLDRLPDESVLVIDEGSLSFASTDVMTREQKQLVKILNVIRQKRMCLIIVAPSFFNLNKYVAVERSRCLLHVYSHGGKRGFFAYFGTKQLRKLYALGKKNFNSYAKPSPRFKDRFTKFDPLGPEYKKLKKKSLRKALDGEGKKINKATTKKEIMKKVMTNLIELNPKWTQTDVAKSMGVSRETVVKYLTETRPMTV